jgi:hypothetical protein
MTRRSIISGMAVPALLLFTLAAGCAREKPVTIVFTGDTQGRLVPAG